MIDVILKNLSKIYRGNPAVQNVNLSFHGPGCIGILGPNGAGKSTLLKLLTGLIPPTSGSVSVNGFDLIKDRLDALSVMGASIESAKPYPYLTGKEVLEFICAIRKRDEKSCASYVADAVRITGMNEYIDRKTSTYSTGMLHRLAIASAIVCEPPVIILDEPTDGLDPRGTKEVRALIKKLSTSGDRLVILTSHILEEIEELCDRRIIMISGKVEYDSMFSEEEEWLEIRTETPFDKSLNSPAIRDCRIEGDIIRVCALEKSSSHEVLEELVRMGVRIKSFNLVTNFEDVYFDLTKGEGVALKQL